MAKTITGQILLLNEKGDDPVATWNELDQASVNSAFAVLTEQLEKTGAMAYAVKDDERVQIKAGDEFPKSAEKIIVVPAMQGG